MQILRNSDSAPTGRWDANNIATASANGDFAEFIGWVDTAAPADTIKVNTYNFKVSKDASYVAVFKYILVDALTGLFTVDDSGKQVISSKGNL